MKYAIYYNYKTIGDVLMIVFESNEKPDKVVKKGDVVILYKQDKLIGINISNFSDVMKLKVDGFIPLINKKMLEVINDLLKNADLTPLEEQKESGYRIAKIVDLDDHPNSEHLHILKVDVGEKDYLDIVCGAYNARVGLKCVCALPYTFLANGQQIVPSKLLGVDSYGMLCSGRELNLPGYENKRGLLELDDSALVGSDFYKEI